MSRKKACSGLDSGVDTGLLPAQFAARRRRGAPYIANLRIAIVAFALAARVTGFIAAATGTCENDA